MQNSIHCLLIELGLSDEDSVKAYFPKTRDRDDVSVLKCEKSGVLFLNRVDHLKQDYYQSKSMASYWNKETREAAIQSTVEDDTRRAGQIKTLIAKKDWLDVGTGAGGILNLLSGSAKSVSAVEPQADMRSMIAKDGFKVYGDIAELPDEAFDFITLFHVFEHIVEPMQALKVLKQKLRPGGELLLEVPHARDVLLSTYDLESFKGFTFWSEHLILHTRQSLEKMLTLHGFKQIAIKGFQRYPLANHLYWLARGKPGGHEQWNSFRDVAVESAYAKLLAELDQTDTLIATAKKE